MHQACSEHFGRGLEDVEEDERELLVQGKEEAAGRKGGMKEFSWWQSCWLVFACSRSLRSVCYGGQGRVVKEKQRSTMA